MLNYQRVVTVYQSITNITLYPYTNASLVVSARWSQPTLMFF